MAGLRLAHALVLFSTDEIFIKIWTTYF